MASRGRPRSPSQQSLRSVCHDKQRFANYKSPKIVKKLLVPLNNIAPSHRPKTARITLVLGKKLIYGNKYVGFE